LDKQHSGSRDRRTQDSILKARQDRDDPDRRLECDTGASSPSRAARGIEKEPQRIAQDDLLAVHSLQDLRVDHILTDHPRDPERRRNHQVPHAILFGSRIPTLPMEASLSGPSSNCKLMKVENNNARTTMPPYPGVFRSVGEFDFGEQTQVVEL